MFDHDCIYCASVPAHTASSRRARGSKVIYCLVGGSMSSAPALAKWRAGSRLHKEDASDVRELWRLVAEQREELRHAKRELLESRTLAMIGTMVQFISHDLRHHLCAVYAGAEFMSSEKVLPLDREVLMEEVGMAIHTMTGLLDSLLLF